MVNDTSDSERGNPPPPLLGYSFQLAARGLLYAPFHRQDRTYTSHGALAGMMNRSLGLKSGIDPTTHHTVSGHSTIELHVASVKLRIL